MKHRHWTQGHADPDVCVVMVEAVMPAVLKVVKEAARDLAQMLYDKPDVWQCDDAARYILLELGAYLTGTITEEFTVNRYQLDEVHTRAWFNVPQESES
jgi:hypothetical protein